MTPSVPFATIEWLGDWRGCARIIDQTRLPGELVYIDIQSATEMCAAIRKLAVRGAPALGVAGGFGVVLGLRDAQSPDPSALLGNLDRVARQVASARPTAVNLSWGVERVAAAVRRSAPLSVEGLIEGALAEAKSILEEDRAMCAAMGRIGGSLVHEGGRFLTHCNAGALATGGMGTALSVFFSAHREGRKFRVFADETRPLLQGARLTAWELLHAGIDVTLITDSMAGHVMKSIGIDRIFVGADRIARNGDTANKIGTYSVAVLAKEHGVPFWVVAPSSTFDLRLQSGAEIEIGERDPSEVTEGFGSRTAPAGVKVFNPAFDVTPARLIAGIVTERGLISPVSEAEIRRVLVG